MNPHLLTLYAPLIEGALRSYPAPYLYQLYPGDSSPETVSQNIRNAYNELYFNHSQRTYLEGTTLNTMWEKFLSAWPRIVVRPDNAQNCILIVPRKRLRIRTRQATAPTFVPGQTSLYAPVPCVVYPETDPDIPELPPPPHTIESLRALIAEHVIPFDVLGHISPSLINEIESECPHLAVARIDDTHYKII